MLDYWYYLKEIVFKYKALVIAIVLIGVILITWLLNTIYMNEDGYNNKVSTISQKQIETSTGEKSQSDIKLKENKVEDVYVDVKGAIKHPNIYKMKSSDRIKQLLDKAKVKDEADLSKVNLAEKLTDQKLIYIPMKGEEISSDTQGNEITNKSLSITSTANNNSNQQTIHLNSATEAQLLTIPGIGPSKAKAIIEYREQNGAFESLEQLTEVKGIGVKTLEKLRSHFEL
ncbi:MAG TPA: helix-hairpin-helix domain-containing protein [Staphylococcus sp.]|nr:helix-hairpin-helix domain-containing protein [Staphylococcus sp.]